MIFHVFEGLIAAIFLGLALVFWLTDSATPSTTALCGTNGVAWLIILLQDREIQLRKRGRP